MKKEINEKKITSVFANRDSFDAKRYIQRERHEIEFKRSLNRYNYVFVIGESGSGKTWLTNYMITKLSYESNYINLSEIAAHGSLLDYIKSTLPEIKEEKTTTIGAEGKIPLVSASGESSTLITINTDYLWDFIEKNTNKIIIFDNFESIINSRQILDDLSCLITLADDPRMKKHNPRFVIIGALGDVVKYFQTMPNYQTISSRVNTVRIGGFTNEETETFVLKGLSDCGYSSINVSELSSRIYLLTRGVPQAVNELCYNIAISFFDGNETEIEQSSELMRKAEISWMAERMLSEYSIISGYYTNNLHEEVLLNYVLFALTENGLREFSTTEIRYQAELYMGNKRKSLPLNRVKKYLEQLSDDSENRNLLIKIYADGYKVKSYKTLACLSISLYLHNDDVRCIDDLYSVDFENVGFENKTNISI